MPLSFSCLDYLLFFSLVFFHQFNYCLQSIDWRKLANCSSYSNSIKAARTMVGLFKFWIKIPYPLQWGTPTFDAGHAWNDGYVEKEGILINTSTVREMLYYSALLQLNSFWMENKEAVEAAISLMSRGDYSNNLIGSTCYACGLPPGERRYLSIARELVMHPHLLFVDEPLHQLDRNPFEILCILENFSRYCKCSSC